MKKFTYTILVVAIGLFISSSLISQKVTLQLTMDLHRMALVVAAALVMLMEYLFLINEKLIGFSI
ncbi:MAG: hypothetical protein R2750_10410 [Bacteroidales bacterium]